MIVVCTQRDYSCLLTFLPPGKLQMAHFVHKIRQFKIFYRLFGFSTFNELKQFWYLFKEIYNSLVHKERFILSKCWSLLVLYIIVFLPTLDVDLYNRRCCCKETPSKTGWNLDNFYPHYTAISKVVFQSATCAFLTSVCCVKRAYL